MNRLVAVLACAVPFMIVGVAEAATVADLGPTSAYAWSAVNDAGQAAGTEFGAGPVRFSGGVTTRVGGSAASGAVAIDGTGRLFGSEALPSAKSPVWWDVANGQHNLAGIRSEAAGFKAASENGTALGFTSGGPFIQTPANGFLALPFGEAALPVAVNDAGHVIYAGAGATSFWNGQTSTPLPVAVSGGKVLSSSDDVAGLLAGAPVIRHANGSTTPLAAAPDGASSVSLAAIADDGTVVGSAYPPGAGASRAVIWQDGSARFLDELFPAGSGWAAQSALDISNTGKVLGVGTQGGVSKAFLLDLGVCSTASSASLNEFSASQNAAGCGAEGIDWTVPDRLKDIQATRAAGGPWGAAQTAYVFPGKWHADVFLTAGRQPFAKASECANSNVEWRWTVTPAPIKKPRTGCKIGIDVKKLGKYAVLAKRYERTKPGARWVYSKEKFTKTVEVKDWVIVGMGDSNGSGEGNPDWIYPRCNRSRASYQFRTALFLETQDPHSSVTFVFTSCSGASIEHLVSTPYRGIRPQTPALPSQIDQVEAILTPPNPSLPRRRADAAIVSIGVNDLAFGAVGFFCATHPSPPLSVGGGCETTKVKLIIDRAKGTSALVANPRSARTVNEQVGVRLSLLPGLYRTLRAGLLRSRLGLPLHRVHLTPYPDFASDESGAMCNTTGYAGSVIRWNTETWAWFSKQSGLLNKKVRQSASNGWQVSPLKDDAFSGHGYCAGGLPTFAASYIRGVANARATDDAAGPLHPTGPGHQLEADAQSGQLCATLYRNTVCVGKWR